MLCNAIHIKEYEINNSIIILSSYAWTVMLPPRRLTIVCMQLPYKDPCDFPGYEGTCFSVVQCMWASVSLWENKVSYQLSKLPTLVQTVT